jgi:Xaa-Pro aminopeptidase
MFKKDVYINRRKHLLERVKDGVILILGNNDSPMNYPANAYHFRQDSDFLYFFGHDLAGMAGVIDVDAGKVILFADDVDMDDIIWMGPQPSVKSLASEVGVEITAPFGKLAEFLSDAQKKGRKIHFLPQYRHDNMIFLNQTLDVDFSKMKDAASSELIKAVVSLRSIKDKYEIEEIDKACDIGYLMHTEAMRNVKPGMLEREIAGLMEGISLSYGGVPSFPIILTINGQTLHNHYHGNMMKEGDLMLADAGCETTRHYASDNTRTTPVSGKFTSKQREIYEIVMNANNHAFSLIKPGITYRDVHLAAAKVLASGLTDLGIMKGNPEDAVREGAHALFQPHGLGHMMGLDVHDMEGLGENFVGYDDKIQRSKQFGLSGLRLGRVLQPGFVLTNEPGCYFIPELMDAWHHEKKFVEFIDYNKLKEYRDFGGIRLEDDILVTEMGCRLLGKKRIPITPDEVEDMYRS